MKLESMVWKAINSKMRRDNKQMIEDEKKYRKEKSERGRFFQERYQQRLRRRKLFGG